MIHLDRGLAPDYFGSRRHRIAFEELEVHFESYGSTKRQASRPFRPLPPEVRDALLDRTGGKCAYCETPVAATGSVHVEQFRPKQGARGFGASGTADAADEGTYYETHYWWLALDWDNLLVACPTCNRAKAPWFPLEDESQRAALPGEPGPSVEDEQPLLLDPSTDRPERHIRYRRDGTAEPLSNRGAVTIDLLALNRGPLVNGRRKALDEAEALVQTVARDPEGPHDYAVRRLADVFAPGPVAASYLGIQRQFLADWLAEHDEVGDLVGWSVDAARWEAGEAASLAPTQGPVLPADRPLDLGRLAIERIEITNFKTIERLAIDVPQNPDAGVAPWLVFLGENAVGKSSILQAVVLTLIGHGERARLSDIEPRDVLRYVRDGDDLVYTDEGSVTIWEIGRSEPHTLIFRDGQEEFEGSVGEPRTTIVAYGSTRLLPDGDLVSDEFDGRVRVRNLFRPSTPLVDAEVWLLRLAAVDPVQFDLVVRGLREMLLLGDEETLTPDLVDDRILIDVQGERTVLGHLSDGYRTILALATDMMATFSQAGTSMEEAEGVVVIDELGTNLHPSWRKRIVSCFRRVFPRVQFVVSTHEPLCLRGLSGGETVLLRRDLEGAVVAVTTLPNPADLRVDELLLSEFFGLNTTVDTDLEEVYDEYYKLLLVERPRAAQRKRMDELKEQLREREHLGHGLRDELMYEVIDKLVARELHSGDPKPRPALKEETLEKVLDAWAAAGLATDRRADDTAIA